MTEIISDTLTKLSLQDKEIFLLGTAHVSSGSVEEVQRFIEEHEPDRICLELDQGRYTTMEQGQSWENMNIQSILKQGKGFFLLANLALSSFQRKMGAMTGVAPGGEMKAATEAAKAAGIPISLCDRDIQVTLRRAWKKSSLWNRMKLLGTLLSAAFSKEELSSEEVENLKDRSALDGMMGELAKELPTVKEVLIDERDTYLATKIYQAPGKRILAPIGAGHAPGIIRIIERLESDPSFKTDIREIEQVPPSSKITRFLPWVIPAIVIGLLAAGFVRAGWDQGVKMFTYWFLVNGILSGIGAIIALAHPVTIILSFLLAPFTSLNPTIGVGIVVGILEATIRKPRVKDFQNINTDILSIRGFYRNRVTHALIVFFLTSVGSSIGTFIAFPFLVSLLGNG